MAWLTASPPAVRRGERDERLCVGDERGSVLAVKLHSKPKPWLGRNSSLVPILSWEVGRTQVRNWVRWLSGPCGRINFVTLVRIPGDWPVKFFAQYGNSNILKLVLWQDLKPLREVPQEFKRALMEWWNAWSGWSDQPEPGGLMSDEPQIVLGRGLPESCIKWTKDIRLLYGKKSKRRTGNREKV